MNRIVGAYFDLATRIGFKIFDFHMPRSPKYQHHAYQAVVNTEYIEIGKRATEEMTTERVARLDAEQRESSLRERYELAERTLTSVENLLKTKNIKQALKTLRAYREVEL
jgi:hypothetical protein